MERRGAIHSAVSLSLLWKGCNVSRAVGDLCAKITVFACNSVASVSCECAPWPHTPGGERDDNWCLPTLELSLCRTSALIRQQASRFHQPLPSNGLFCSPGSTASHTKRSASNSKPLSCVVHVI